MILAKILSSYTFRYALGAVVVIGMVVMFVMVIVYGVFSYNYFHSVHDELSAELNEFALSYETGGIESVDGFINQRGQRFHTTQFAYVLVDNNLRKMAGNLDSWPKFREYGDGWLSFELGILQGDGDSKDQEFVARSSQMSDGNQLLVARSYEGVLAYIRFVVGILFRGFIVTVCLGALAAFFMTWAFQRRLDTINQSIKTIMAGDLSERLRVNDSSSEIEQLAINLNVMLDRIQYLMDGVKQVSDNIAHDLRTPLTRLRNHLANFEKKCSDEDLVIVQQLIAEADEMLTTFNALLRIARIELGECGSEKHPLRLDTLVSDVIELYEPVAADKNVALESTFVPIELYADRNLLFQAFANLLDNAIKYTPSGGNVWVSIDANSGASKQLLAQEFPNHHYHDETVVITIADSGCGIAEQNHEKVFRRFYREESSRSKQPGNGLGLSLVAAVAKMHDARLLLKSNSPGLCVHIIFPPIQMRSQTSESNVQVLSSLNVNAEVSTSTVL